MQLGFETLLTFCAIYLLNFLFSLYMENFENDETSKKIKKTKEEINQQLNESAIDNENVNTDIKELAGKVKKVKIKSKDFLILYVFLTNCFGSI